MDGQEVTMETGGKIYRQITQVMKDVGAVAKKDRNVQQGFNYRGIDAVMNAINPAFQKHGVFVVPTILEQVRECKTTAKGNVMNYSVCKIEYRFYAEDGSFVKAIVIGEAMDSADKATNKAMAVAFKYACFQVLCIPTEEMKDPDASGEPVAPRPSQPVEKAAQGKKKESETKPVIQAEPEINPNQAANKNIDEAKKNTILSELGRTGVELPTILRLFKIKALEEMTTDQFIKVMKKFSATPDKEA